MSVNKVNKTTGDLSLLAGWGANTSLITESSALPNIGTSANATQHEVNVAIDEVIGGIGTIIKAEGNVHPTTANAEFVICQATIPAGTWIVNCFSDLNYHGSGTYNNIFRVTGSISKTARTGCTNGGGNMVTSVISIDSPGVAYAMGYATPEMVGGADYKQRSLIEAIRIK